MEENFAILELKYGNIYGGYPNFFAIAEIALLAFEPSSKRIFLESWSNNSDVDYVSVDTKINDLGHTTERYRTVVNMRTRRRKPFDPDFQLNEEDLQAQFGKLRATRNNVKRFLNNNLRKYRVAELYTFDGRRDIFLCERSGINFERVHIRDLQKEINDETNYLFSLKKLGVVAQFDFDGNYVRSTNEEYWLHPIAARQIMPRSAAFDAAQLLMIQREFACNREGFLIRAAQLLQKIAIEDPAPAIKGPTARGPITRPQVMPEEREPQARQDSQPSAADQAAEGVIKDAPTGESNTPAESHAEVEAAPKEG